MKRCLSVCALLVLAMPGNPLLAQEAPRAEGPKLLTPEASLNLAKAYFFAPTRHGFVHTSVALIAV